MSTHAHERTANRGRARTRLVIRSLDKRNGESPDWRRRLRRDQKVAKVGMGAHEEEGGVQVVQYLTSRSLQMRGGVE